MSDFITKVKEPIVSPNYLDLMVSLMRVDKMAEQIRAPKRKRKLLAIKKDLERICNQI